MSVGIAILTFQVWRVEDGVFTLIAQSSDLMTAKARARNEEKKGIPGRIVVTGLV